MNSFHGVHTVSGAHPRATNSIIIKCLRQNDSVSGFYLFLSVLNVLSLCRAGEPSLKLSTGDPSTRLPGEAASVPAAQTPVSPLRSEHDVLSQTGPVRDERTGPERSRHGPAAPVGGISRYGPEPTEQTDPFQTKPPE